MVQISGGSTTLGDGLAVFSAKLGSLNSFGVAKTATLPSKRR
jgi:hypothetical protein